MSETEEEVKPEESTASASNRRNEKRKELLHDKRTIRDTAKEHRELKEDAGYRGHYMATGQHLCKMVEKLGEYYSFEFTLVIEEAKNFLRKTEYSAGDEEKNLELLLDKIHAGLKHIFSERAQMRTPL